MKTIWVASLFAATLLLTAPGAFGDDEKAAEQELAKPDNLSSQVIDTGKDAGKPDKSDATDATGATTKSDDDAKPVPHFAGHAFSE